MKPLVPFLGLLLMVGGCDAPPASSSPAASDVPKFPRAGSTPSNGRFKEVVVDQASGRRVWLYAPAKGQKPKGLIVIAAAGGNMITGTVLTEGDTPEHLPWANAGYAVAAYEVSGPMPEGDDQRKLQNAVDAYLARETGVSDGRDAIEAGVKAFPAAAEHIIAVGHSSAGTLALALAAHDRRIEKCVAFAPVTDVLAHLGPENVRALSVRSGARDTFSRNSPASLVSKLKKPTFLFVAKDDSVVSAASVEAYAARLRVTGCPVTLKTVATGDHYDPMRKFGQPLALAWLRAQN
jgi:dipeptidyl aminopeptidase/acylaminoacyl peptidase